MSGWRWLILAAACVAFFLAAEALFRALGDDEDDGG